ncbi:MAG TPA: hypothetical protein VGD31_16525 [Sphingobacteriaceae bacterium]
MLGSEGRDFERACLPYLRAIWFDVIQPQPLRTHDNNGVDILCWQPKAGKSIPLVVQCKGFLVTETELGADQIKQCKQSIKKFNKSPFQTNLYILIINRHLNNQSFRTEIETELNSLKTSGKAVEVRLWSFQDLLKEAVKAVRKRCIKLLSLNSNRIENIRVDRQLCEPLEEVPLEIFEMTITPNRKRDEKLIEKVVADPAQKIINIKKNNRTLVLAKAGYGKTTTALRIYHLTNKKIFYLSGATLPDIHNSSDALLKRWFVLDKFWADIEPEDYDILETLYSLAVTYILRDSKNEIMLILDALDESIYFNRASGIQDLWNQTGDVKVPVILLAREEFWEKKQIDFSTTFGKEVQRQDRTKISRVNLMKLNDWQQPQIKQFTERYLKTLSASEAANIKELLEKIDNGEYEKIYGDIPKRPLFLNYILESVAYEGIRKKGKARLFFEWAEMKVRRDINNPLILGGKGRSPVLRGKELRENEIVQLSFKAMKIAATKMVLIENNSLELLPYCDIEKIKDEDIQFKQLLDSVSLFLHSLLEEERSTAEKQTIRFTHRTFQEFFLALYIRDNLKLFETIVLPSSIKEHLAEIQAENI